MATRSWTDLGPAYGSSSEAKDPSPPPQQERTTQYPINDIEEAGRTVDEGPLAKRAARVEGAAAKGWRTKQVAKKAAKQAAKQGDVVGGGESKSGKAGKHNHAQQQGKGGKQRITGTYASVNHTRSTVTRVTLHRPLWALAGPRTHHTTRREVVDLAHVRSRGPPPVL